MNDFFPLPFIKSVSFLMEQVCNEVPQDCWELIISNFDEDHPNQWEQMSMVSKNFLTLTNCLRPSMRVVHPAVEVFCKQLQRFPNLKKIDLSEFEGSIQEALLEIAISGIRIEELNVSGNHNLPVMLLKFLNPQLKNLKVLNCSKSCLSDYDLLVLADSFPWIEELDISNQHIQEITDQGIVAASTKLRRLRKINLSGNIKISDQSIIYLSSNCEFLTEILLRYCHNISVTGINFAMRLSQSCNSLILAASDFFCSLQLEIPLDFSKSISTIDLYLAKISDDFLYGIVNADLPLRNFHLSFCKNFTLRGIFSLLNAYPFLTSFSLISMNRLSDEFVMSISPYISKLVSIRLNYCSRLTAASFISIASSCPRITNIEIGSLAQAKADLDHVSGYQKNPSIKSASLRHRTFRELLPICPNLQVLTVTKLDRQELDIALIINYCSEIRRLIVNRCDKLKFSTKEAEKDEFCKLEYLSAKTSNIDDQMLEMVGKTCPKLVQLDLEDCKRVTEIGVRKVVEHCRRLRYVNLNWCLKVSKDVVDWMVVSLPSLRKVVTPNPTDHTEEEKQRFLKHGCLVIPGTWE